MMKAAVIGFGTISGTHMKAIAANDGMELAAICDIKEELKVKVPEGVAFYTDYKQMCQEIKPDVVHICLPHYLHYPVTKDVVEMGFNVFCEKPVALNVEEAEAFAALEEAHPEVKIGICLQNRMNDTTIELKKILDSGEYGEIRGVRGFVPWYRDSSYYEVSPWRGIMQYAGGGCMINQALHTLDLLYYFGGDISRIHAVVGQTNDLGIEVEGDIVRGLSMQTVPEVYSLPRPTTGQTNRYRSGSPARRLLSRLRTTGSTSSFPAVNGRYLWLPSAGTMPSSTTVPLTRG